MSAADFFARVGLELGVVTWPNGADLDPLWIYEGVKRKKLWSVPFYPVVAIYAPQISYAMWGTTNAIIAGATGGFIAGGIQGGTLQSAITGGISGGLFGWAGGVGDPTSLGRYGAHALAGCLSGEMGGGGCGRGAVSAVAGKWATNAADGWSNEGKFVASVVAGGTVSVIGGGSFANGAQTAAFGYMFNFLISDYNKKTDILTMKDTDTGKVTKVRVFSGGDGYLPVDNGEYDMLQYRESKVKLRLEPIDAVYGNDKNDATGRTVFRFHHYGLGGNEGCISTINDAQWGKAAQAIFSTRTSTATVFSKSDGGGTETLKAYGRLRVHSGE